MDADQLQARLAELAEKNHVVGASLAVGVGDETCTAATGVLNLRTGQPVTPESLFQIGSITKPWTATLVMQLVDDGLLDLDTPVVQYLPEFRVRDDETTAGVTARHLLTHTSGISGDFFPETGRGDDCLERYVHAMADLGSCHPLGATTSYCNAGFVLLGRVVEVLRGGTWDDILRERLFVPLGLGSAGTLPEQALLWGAAVGHIADSVTPQWGMPRCGGPTGGIHARAEDLVTFARLHLAGGVTAGGATVLSETSTNAMRQPQAEVIDSLPRGEQIGLAWMLNDWGRPIFGHGGATLGQHASLLSVSGPEPVTIALLTNGGDHQELYQSLYAELLSELAGIDMPARLEPPARPVEVDPAGYVGTYVRESMTYMVDERDGELVLVARPSGVLAMALGTDQIEAPLIPIGDDAFLTQIPGTPGWSPVVFTALGTGERYLHLVGLAAPRRP